jgi:uncharacterized protein YbjQ (UPF0145 family)
MTSFDPLTIPQTQQRLSLAKQGFFSSNLTTDEFVLLRNAGFRPLSMVMGSSVYHVGIQTSSWGTSQELEVLTGAMHGGRTAAMNRMVREAQALGADGVVGTALRARSYTGSLEHLEFIALGTAISYAAQPGVLAQRQTPFTSHLAAQDFLKLWRSGYVPTHFGFGVCVYHVAHQSFRQMLKQFARNSEMPNFTEAVYDARELAMSRLQQEAQQWGSEGLVGTDLLVNEWVWGEHASEFMALGTGIRQHNITVEPLPQPTPVLPLGS